MDRAKGGERVVTRERTFPFCFCSTVALYVSFQQKAQALFAEPTFSDQPLSSREIKIFSFGCDFRFYFLRLRV
jgi:hypothetical protein